MINTYSSWRQLIVSSIVLATFFLLPVVSLAAGSISLSPAKIEYALSPGESVSGEIRVINNLGRPTTFRVEVEDFGPGTQSDETLSFLGNDRGPYSLANYLSIATESLSALSGETVSLPFTINLPATAPPGGFYTAVTVLAEPPPGGEAVVAVRLSATIFVRINGPVKEEGKLVNFGLTGGSFQFFNNQTNFNWSYQNTGNVYLNPYGGVERRRVLGWGKKLLVGIVEPNFVLPGSTRLRELTLPAGLDCGWFKATIKLNRGYDNIVDEKTAHYLACSPVGAAVAGVGAVIILLVTYLMLKLKRRLRHE